MRRIGIVALALALSGPAIAGQPEPVNLAPLTHSKAELVVVAPDGSQKAYSPSEIELFPTFRIETKTPWREVPAQFDGILLRDLLEANGLAELPAIRVLAENDYAVTIEREVWESVDILVATRVNDKPHSRRARGPIQFIIDRDAFEASEYAGDSHLVWMAARIEPVE
ncbi:MAG: hypothetical protein HKN27_05575 [Silicimonas sp.]|nr:hypothetical protein [Silicimonas sp.]